MCLFFQRPLLSVLLILSFAPCTMAAGEAIKVEFVTLAFNGAFPGYFYKNGQEVLKLDASQQGISAPVLYHGPSTLLLFENEADLAPRENGEAPPKPTLTVRIPSGNDRVLLVFAYTKTHKDIPTSKVYGISTKAMKEGDYRLFNFSKQTIYAVFNEKKVAAVPGKIASISSASWKRDTQDMNVQLGLKKEQKVQAVYSSIWGHRPVRRHFVFVFDRPDKYRPLDVRMFYDVPSIRAAQKKNSSVHNDVPPSE